MNSEPDDQPPARFPNNPLFRAVILISAVFLLTVLLLIATSFSSSRSGVVRFMNDYGVQVILGEVAAVLSLTFLAMAIDRRQTLLRQARDRTADSETPGSTASAESSTGQRPE